jgi:hypothetical protein
MMPFAGDGKLPEPQRFRSIKNAPAAQATAKISIFLPMELPP